jgi:hypothetical protein
MNNEVLKSDAEVVLTEAMSVLTGLKSYGLLERSGSECDGLLPILLDRACGLLANPTVAKSINYGASRALDAPYEDHEVLGLDSDGQVVCWDAGSMHEYACGEKLEGYGVANLKLHELARVGVSVDAWLQATVAQQSDRDRQQGWSRNVFVNAHSTSEYGGDGPTYARTVVDATFIARLLHLASLCKKDGLSEVRVCDGPELWGACNEDGMGLTCAELVVCGSSFWFVDAPKHSNFTIESDAQQIGGLLQAVMSGEGDVYLSGDPEQLRQLVEDDEGSHASDLSRR